MSEHNIYKDIFERIQDAIVVVDLEFNILQWNAAAENKYGWQLSEVMGKSLHDVFKLSSYVDRATEREMANSLANNSVWNGEINQPDKNGNLLTVEAFFSLLKDSENKHIGFVSIFRDITEKKEDEHLLLEYRQRLEENNRRLEKANELKNQFLATTSHELRTPLNGIIGFLNLVLQGVAHNKDEENKFLNLALSSSKHLLKLINDILDISKIEAGKLRLESEIVNFEELWSEVAGLIEVQTNEKGIYLHYTALPEGNVFVNADRARCKQVLLNLLSNAVKFTNEGGITFTVEQFPQRGYVEFSVVDTGIGIPKTAQHRLFKMFAQVDSLLGRQSGGTGLGLAITKSLVEKMGGVISLESEGIEKGTRVVFRLPIGTQKEKLHTATQPSAPQHATPTNEQLPLIYIIEDDVMYSTLIRDVFEDSGAYRIHSVTTADEALPEIIEMKPFVILSDYALPSASGANLSNGFDLLKKIREIPALTRTPFILMSGHSDICREVEEFDGEGNVTKAFVKPIDIHQLVQTVKNFSSEPVTEHA